MLAPRLLEIKNQTALTFQNKSTQTLEQRYQWLVNRMLILELHLAPPRLHYPCCPMEDPDFGGWFHG